MTPDDSTDPMFRVLARLPSAVPSARSVQRTQAECYAALARHQQQPTRPRRPGTFIARIVDAAIFAALCIYLTEAAREAFRLGLLR